MAISRDQSVSHFHDRDAAAETAVHLGKLQPDVTSANDNQMLWEKIQLHHAGVCEVVDVVKAGNFRDGCTRPLAALR